MTGAQSLALLLYAVSVVAGYPSQQKPDYLTPTVSAALKALTIILVLYGLIGSVVSLSLDRVIGWFGIIAGIGAMALFEAIVDGTKLWQSHAHISSSLQGDSQGSTGTNFQGTAGSETQFSDPGFDNDSSFDFDDDSSPFEDDTSSFDTNSFDLSHADETDSIETKLHEVEDHLDDLQSDQDAISRDSLLNHLDDEFDDVEDGVGKSIVINGDVVIDQHEEHETTDARNITDETTIDDSVINRSDIDTESPSFDEE